jgi:hypothetical protein
LLVAGDADQLELTGEHPPLFEPLDRRNARTPHDRTTTLVTPGHGLLLTIVEHATKK